MKIDFDLADLDDSSTSRNEYSVPEIPYGSDEIHVEATDGVIMLYSRTDLSSTPVGEYLTGVKRVATTRGVNIYRCRLSSVNAWSLRYTLRKFKPVVDSESAKVLKGLADQVEAPVVVLESRGTHINVKVPNLKVFREMMRALSAYPNSNGYRMPISKVQDLVAMNKNRDDPLPRLKFHDDVKKLNSEPIPGFDGTLDSLRDVPVNVLNVVAADVQTAKMRKATKSKKPMTLAEKMTKIGIKSLYDLIFWIPRRYIDRNGTQDIRGLLENETITILGRVESVKELNGKVSGSRFIIGLGNSSSISSISCSFFNQQWLMSKFHVGDEVLVVGKYKPWNGRPSISGISMDSAREAEVLPVIPVYNQSPSNGLTSKVILSAVREMLSRLGDAQLAPYIDPFKVSEAVEQALKEPDENEDIDKIDFGFDDDSEDSSGGNQNTVTSDDSSEHDSQKQGMSYFEAISNIHLPDRVDDFREAQNILAMIEMIYMQIMILLAKESDNGKQAVSITEGDGKLQAKAIKSLPFELTKSQKKALVGMNRKVAQSAPSSTLLSADVGAGKTVVAQMMALRAVDSGFQAALIAPTDVLARQLYNSTVKVSQALEDRFGDHVEIALLSGSMSAADKRDTKKAIKDGSAQVVVGTHALMAKSVKFANLGFVAVDEQQKFGVEQREALLRSRSDSLMLHLLTMTATPIPRSTAQVFYGDVDLIELKEKPPGRLEIITEWIQEDPVLFTEQSVNKVWNDVISEAKKGNQTFIVTPLVNESAQVDAASVDATVDSLSKLALTSLRVAKVHGKMKPDEARKVMQDFRDKKYDVLVASTVVEVGVDVPDATRVVILSADRLGSSSLHQIRGRVGRSSKQSKCYLVSNKETEQVRSRLMSLVESNDGFKIAQQDLNVRGEGKVFGSQQSGAGSMMFASVVKHVSMIDGARSIAEDILSSRYREQAVEDARHYLGLDDDRKEAVL